jgi:hemoglobin-like flavoprotein
MTEKQIAAVKKSWKIIAQINPEIVGDVFYSKLFLETPELRRLFTTDRAEQSRKLVMMLTYIITRLDRLETLKTDIQALAIRHVQYGVLDSHYQKVGTALLWTLEKALGNDFDGFTKQAWIDCYTMLSEAMITATKGEAATV